MLFSRQNRFFALFLLLVAGVIFVFMAAQAFSASPLTLDTQEGDAHITAAIDRSHILFSSDCVTMSWAVNGIREITVDGRGAIGEGTKQICLSYLKQPSLQVTFNDGSRATYTLPVKVLSLDPTVWLLLVIAILCLVPALRRLRGTRWPLLGWHDERISFVLIVLVHLVIGFYFAAIDGANLHQFSWDSYIQNIPSDLIRTDLISSVWYRHTQPPIFSLFGAFFVKFFPSNPLEAYYVAQIVLGAFMSGAVFVIAKHLIRNHALAFVVALIYAALHPSLFRFEAMPLYPELTAALIVLCVAYLVFFTRRRQIGYLYLFIFTFNLLILTRASYHIILLIVVIPVVSLLAADKWRRVLVISVLISLMSIGWCAKNLLMYDFFGLSSWSTISYWRAVTATMPDEEIEALVDEGVLPPVIIEVGSYDIPSLYAPYGYFEKTSDIPVLARDNQDNINYLDIADIYTHGALEVLRRYPSHYLWQSYRAYLNYNCPSVASEVTYNALNTLYGIHTEIAQGGWLIRPFQGDFGAVGCGAQREPLLPTFILFPAALVSYTLLTLRRIWRNRQGWLETIRAEAPALFTAFIMLYTTLLSNFFEFAETHRYKFDVEIISWVFLIMALYHYLFKPLTARWQRSP